MNQLTNEMVAFINKYNLDLEVDNCQENLFKAIMQEKQQEVLKPLLGKSIRVQLRKKCGDKVVYGELVNLSNQNAVISADNTLMEIPIANIGEAYMYPSPISK